jgi:UDP-N-acetylmuramoyl-tripeptide--D-alanyl-D-alanine ligase
MSAEWGAITAGDILPSVSGEMLRGSRAKRFKGFSADSRSITEDCLFWALKGERFDGHDFVSQAIRKGAGGAVVRKGFSLDLPADRDVAMIAVGDTLRALGDFASWWRHQHRSRVVGITGSAGKTSTKEMAAAALGLRGVTLKNEGNFNNLIGLPVTLLLLEEKHRFAVLEMGMNHPGEIGRLTEIADPEIGVITNVARAHLEGVGSIEGVARAKVELIERMGSHAVAVLNGDDPVLMRAAFPFKKQMLTFGKGPKNDVKAENIRALDREGISFDIHYEAKSFPVKLNVPGFQNVYNALAAAAVGLQVGLSSEELVEGLRTFKGIHGRFTITRLPGGVILVDDTYNSNPFSLQAAMDSMKDLAEGRRILVGLGEMFELGNETVRAHREAGAMVADLGARCFVALGEHARVMIQGAVDKGLPEERAVEVRDHKEMEKRIRAEMKEGDFVFLKGSRRAGLDKVAERLRAHAV